MLSTRKVWLGLAVALAALATLSVAGAQDYGTLQGNNGRTGKTADPFTYGPGVANLTWFWPNSFGNPAAPITSIRDNSSNATNRFPGVGTGLLGSGWGAPANGTEAASFYTIAKGLDAAINAVTGAVLIDPARPLNPPPVPGYEFMQTFPSSPGSHKDPTVTPGSSIFTWTIDPTQDFDPPHAVQATNYQLFVWLPNGPTGPVGGPFIFPNRYYVYKIDYGPGGSLHWIDVVDTNVAGQGWVRLGNGGAATNQVFPYDGVTPIQIHLYNLMWRDALDNVLEDTSVTRAVYADAAMAQPDNGYNTSTPVITQIGTGITQRNQVIQCSNRTTVTTDNGTQQTVVTPEVDAFLADGSGPGGNSPIWKWSPVDVSPFATVMDNIDATWNPAVWTSENIVPHHGADYLTSPITNTPTSPPVDWVVYQPTLEDGDYQIQVYCGGNQGAEQFGTQVFVFVWEGANLLATVPIDESIPGWKTISTQRFPHQGSIGNNLHIGISNYSPLATDAGLKSYADEVRFVGAFNETINATPVQTKATVNVAGSLQQKDVVVVACDDGHIYCLDALGNGDGTTTLYWAYPSIVRPNMNPPDTDPNWAANLDGDGSSIITQMPDDGFGLGSPIVQNIGATQDYCYVAAKNGRVYCIDMTGRGDGNTATGKVGTTKRIWSWPNDLPGAPRSLPLSGGFGGSIAVTTTAQGLTVFVPAMEGRLFALDALGNPGLRTTTTRWMYPLKTTQNLGPITTTPTVDFGRVYFGTSRLNDTVPGQFYALNADTGAFVWNFEGDPNTALADNFRGGSATATAAQLQGGVTNNMIYCTNDNTFVYGLDADTGQLLWQTNELGSTFTGHPLFTWASVRNQAGTSQGFPLVMVPTDDGRFDGLFARAADVNVAGGRLGWEYVSASNSIQASFSNGRNFMYGADMSGNMYAWSAGAAVGGLGNPPGGATLTPNNPVAQLFKDAKIALLTRKGYEALRLTNQAVDPNGDTTFLSHDFVVNPANGLIFNRHNFEWGETAYFLVYDIPTLTTDQATPPNQIAPAVANFQIGVEGASVRQYSVQCKHFGPPPPAGNPLENDYAILAFPIQGAGPTSLPPGAATTRVSFSTAAGGTNAGLPSTPENVVFNTSFGFTVANPLGLIMPDINGNQGLGSLTFGINPDPSTIERNRNGSPNILGGTQGSLLAQTEGVISNGQTGIGHFWMVDMSVLNLLKGGTRGLEQVRLVRNDMAWQGGQPAVINQLDPILYPAFEDLPVNFPNTSIDYPNIARENIRATKDPTGTAENLIVSTSGVSLIPPIMPANYNETKIALRVPQPVYVELDVDAPRFQPANNDPSRYFTNSGGMSLPSGYLSRFDAYVDSNGNALLDTINGRREAYRALTSTLAVALDNRLAVTTPVVDLGSLAIGTGYSPLSPGSAGPSNLSPWPALAAGMLDLLGRPRSPITTTDPEYVALFQPLVIQNLGNVNALNVRLAKDVSVNNGALAPWPIYSNSVDDLGWLDTSSYVFTNFDWLYGLVPQTSVQKARVGDIVPTTMNLNPTLRANQNLGVNQTTFIPNPPVGVDFRPMIGASIPIGQPAGPYSQTMRVIDDLIGPGNGTVPFGNQALNVDAANNPLEPMSDPTFILKFVVREARLTNNATKATVAPNNAFIDYPQAAVNQQNLEYSNSLPSGFRTLDGALAVAYTSPQPGFNSPLPTVPNTTPQYQIYLASLPGVQPLNAAPPTNDLGGFNPFNGTRWFRQEVGPYPGGPAVWPGLFQVQAGSTVTDARFGSPVFPGNGLIDPLGIQNFTFLNMAFVGNAEIQTAAGRQTESRIMTAKVSLNASGAVTIGAPNVMPFDPSTPKGRPSIYQVQGGSVVFYSATDNGNPAIFYTVTDGATYAQPTVFSVGNGFETVASPSAQIRQYLGVNGAQPYVELTFAGKLRGRSNTEIYYARAAVGSVTVGNTTINGVPASPIYMQPRTGEILIPGNEAGLYQAQGVIWRQGAPINVYVSVNGGIPVNVAAGAATLDRQSGLIRFDSKLGGTIYVDPNLGTVRFASTVPLKSSVVSLDYTPRFLRISDSTISGHGSPAILWDNRISGDCSSFSYWFDVVAGGAVQNVNPNTATPRAARYVFTYTQSATGAGLASRPYWKTLRVGVQLGTPIATDAGGNVTGLTINGATGPVQVDPANGRIYFQAADEDRVVTIAYNGFDPKTQNNITFAPANYQVGLVVEKPEQPVPIDQAVNESTLTPFLDPFDSITPRRPGLIWMFYSSTRAGTQDLYFQTMAPRFTPVINGR